MRRHARASETRRHRRLTCVALRRSSNTRQTWQTQASHRERERNMKKKKEREKNKGKKEKLLTENKVSRNKVRLSTSGLCTVS